MDLLKAIVDVLKSAHQPLNLGVVAEKVNAPCAPAGLRTRRERTMRGTAG